MPKRRVKLEFEDDEGGKYSMLIDGNFSREKILKVMDMVDLISGNSKSLEEELLTGKDTMFSNLYNLIYNKFSFGSFSSNNILEAYEDEYSTPIRLSTISTYLQRFTNKGILNRTKTNSGWTYEKAQIKLQR